LAVRHSAAIIHAVLSDAVRDCAGRARELAAQTEHERRVSPELSDTLARAGLYQLCVPESLGGQEAPPQVLVESVEALAVADAAPAWCVAVCATAGMLTAYLPADAAREVAGGGDNVLGGVFAPMGRAVAHDGGFTVSGRWRFASNAENCDWLMGGCRVGDAPDVRLVLFPAQDAEVLDTWRVSGLRGTGSHDIAVEELVVPSAHTASLISDRPVQSGPLYSFPPFGLLALSIAAVALGIARGALDDVAELASVKTPTMGTRTLAERPATQAQLAQAEAALRAARVLLYAAVDAAWEAARAGSAIPLALRVDLRLAATHAVTTSAAAVDAAYSLGGGSVIYESSPLQRRFRDVHAATQHMLVGPSTWELAGRALLGLDVDDSQL